MVIDGYGGVSGLSSGVAAHQKEPPPRKGGDSLFEAFATGPRPLRRHQPRETPAPHSRSASVHHSQRVTLVYFGQRLSLARSPSLAMSFPPSPPPPSPAPPRPSLPSPPPRRVGHHSNKGKCVRELKALVAQQPPTELKALVAHQPRQGVLVRGLAGRVINKLSQKGNASKARTPISCARL